MDRLNIEQHGPIIKKGRIEGLGWRAIQERIEAQTGTSVTHTALRNLWVKHMDGEAVDRMLEDARKAAKVAAMKDGQEDGNCPTVDPEKVQEAAVLTGHERFKTLVELLIDGNLTAHIEQGERLKVEYVQYLKLLTQVERN